jgi:uncharacterized membrane protein
MNPFGSLIWWILAALIVAGGLIGFGVLNEDANWLAILGVVIGILVVCFVLWGLSNTRFT